MLYHLGLDHAGTRHRRRCSQAEVRRARERAQLRPILVLAGSAAGTPCQPRWRNGMQRRRYLLLAEQCRGDRCCFLMTLPAPPLVLPVRPF